MRSVGKSFISLLAGFHFLIELFEVQTNLDKGTFLALGWQYKESLYYAAGETTICSMSKSVIWNCLSYRPIWKEGYIYSRGLTIRRVYYMAGETTICLICSRVSHWIVWGAKPHLDKGMSISMVWHDEEWNDHLFDVQECHMRRSTIIGAATGESITREIWDNFVLRLLLMKNPVTSLRRTALDFFSQYWTNLTETIHSLSSKILSQNLD